MPPPDIARRSRPTYFGGFSAHRYPVTQPHGQTVALRGPIFSQRPEHGSSTKSTSSEKRSDALYDATEE